MTFMIGYILQSDTLYQVGYQHCRTYNTILYSCDRVVGAINLYKRGLKDIYYVLYYYGNSFVPGQ